MAAERVAGEGLGQPPRHLPQQIVSGLMAGAVVNPFEAVQIQKHQVNRLTLGQRLPFRSG